MKGFFLFLVVAFCFSCQAIGRVRETPRQCIERYGEVTETRGTPGNGRWALVFEVGDLQITCMFEDGLDACTSISYFKSNGESISREDKFAILDQIGGAEKWEPRMARGEMLCWNAETGDVAFMDRGALIVISKESIRKMRGIGGL